ncbi:MAG: hypothetical protein F4X87_12880 [Chloroflexi bacterium]|nr:hypothetical protein [Chloroflexota bacterium]
MQISWVLLAENVIVNEQMKRMDIVGEFHRVTADQFPHSIPKFYIVCRAKADAQKQVTMPYRVTVRRPSDDLVEIHNSDVSVTIPPNVGPVVGTLIADIQDFEIRSQGRHTITAQLGDSEYSAEFIVAPRRNVTNDTQE